MLLEELLPALSVAVEEVTVPSRGWGRRMVCAGHIVPMAWMHISESC